MRFVTGISGNLSVFPRFVYAKAGIEEICKFQRFHLLQRPKVLVYYQNMESEEL